MAIVEKNNMKVEEEEEEALLKVELPEKLKVGAVEPVEKFRGNKEFEVATALWNRSSFFRVFKRVSRDILKVDD